MGLRGQSMFGTPGSGAGAGLWEAGDPAGWSSWLEQQLCGARAREVICRKCWEKATTSNPNQIRIEKLKKIF